LPRSQTDKGAKRWKQTFIEAYQQIPIIRFAARAANVSRSTVYDARQRDSEFAAQMDSAAAEGAEAIEGKAFSMANAGNERMVMFLLEHVMPEKYGRTQKVDMSDLNTFTIKIADDDSDES
tara:strand:+ start:3713 stop:4075 length:363 start_codon:yes stop_codon:yes gene_type:complete